MIGLFSRYGLLLLILIISGCGKQNKPSDIELNPEFFSQGTFRINETRSLALIVVDERRDKRIGTKGLHNRGGEIIIKGDFSKIINDVISESLDSANFLVVNGNESITPVLKVEIRYLKYELDPGMWTGTAKANSVMKSICTSVSGDIYKKIYTGVHQAKGLHFAPGEQKIQTIVEKAVGNNLDNMMNDKQLVDCISGE